MAIFLYFLLGCFIVGCIWGILSEILPPLFEGILYVVGVGLAIFIIFSLPGWILSWCGVQDSGIISNCCKFVFGIIVLLIVYGQEDDHKILVILRWTLIGYLVGVWFGIGVWTGLVGLIWGVCCYMDSRS